MVKILGVMVEEGEEIGEWRLVGSLRIGTSGEGDRKGTTIGFLGEPRGERRGRLGGKGDGECWGRSSGSVDGET